MSVVPRLYGVYGTVRQAIRTAGMYFDELTFLKTNFPTVTAVIAAVSEVAEETPHPAAVMKWFRRGTVPMPWFAMLLAALEQRHGQPFSLKPYMTSGVME